MLERAVNSALAQSVACEVLVCDHGSTDETPALMKRYGDRVRYLRREHDNGPFFAWTDGVVSATGEYIHITYDDDWIESAFVGQLLELFAPDCAFVFSAAHVHWPDHVEELFNNLLQTGTYPKQIIEDYLLLSPLTISPGCALFRKRDILPAMFVGGVPSARHQYHGVGVDLLMFMMSLINNQSFGFLNTPLAHFSAHAGSITVDAFGNRDRTRDLKAGYREAKKYYLLIKEALESGRGEVLYESAFASARARRMITRT